MSRPMDAQRQKHLLIAGGAALAALLLAVTMTILDTSRGWTPDVTGPVLPDWSSRVASAQRIEITGADGGFSVERDGEGWIMPERDSYPVRPDQIAAIDQLLDGLTYRGGRTADPAKHVQLGLAEPGSEGGATALTIRTNEGDVLDALLFGDVRGATIYLRRPEEDRTYAAALPEGVNGAILSRPADEWLELDFIELGRSRIARTTIQAEDGLAYTLERPASSVRNFALRQPAGWQPVTAGAGNGPASALSRIRFRDVRRADRLTGAIVGYHEAETFDGLRVRLDIIAQGETRWARISAVALTDDALEASRALVARTQGWAYLLSDLSVDRLLRPLSEIADPRREPDDAP